MKIDKQRRPTSGRGLAEGGPAGEDLGCPGIRKFKFYDIHPSPDNPREISDENLAALAASVRRFGLVEPIIVNIRDGKNTIVGGNQRYKVLKDTGVVTGEILCIEVDLSETDEKILNLALNNPHAQGQFVASLNEYIERMQKDIRDNEFLLDLRILDLKKDIGSAGSLAFEEMQLRPYKKCHILLSFPPQLLPAIADAIRPLIKDEQVEIEQSAN